MTQIQHQTIKTVTSNFDRRWELDPGKAYLTEFPEDWLYIKLSMNEFISFQDLGTKIDQKMFIKSRCQNREVYLYGSYYEIREVDGLRYALGVVKHYNKSMWSLLVDPQIKDKLYEKIPIDSDIED